MGLSSILLQIISLRQLLAVFSGNELDIGITLSVWLTAVGLGSYAGHRIKFKHAFAVSFLVVGLLSQPAILLINLIRPSLPFEFGETIPLTTTIIATVISLLPLCFVTAMTIQAVISFVVGSPVVGYGSAGNPIHHGFGERLVSVIPLYIGKGHYYRVEYVLFVLSLHPVRET